MAKILVTNDDGLSALGLHVLATVLAGRHDVYVVAPDRERSGVSHAFTLLNPLRCDPAPDALGRGPVKAIYRCSGTPVDCVKVGLIALFPDVRFDLVVSGINPGANLTIDALYSGTVAGAMEALMMGYPGLAVSLVTKPGHHSSTLEGYETAAGLCLEYLDRHEDRILSNRDFILNMNVPDLPRDEIRGTKNTVIGRCRYADRYHVHKDPRGRDVYWLDGHPVVMDERPHADILAVRAGWVSVSPLWFDLTAAGGLETLDSWNSGPVVRPRRKPSRR